MKREYGKVKKVSINEPVDSLIQGILSENMTDSAAQSATRKLAGHFVDWNDLRVSRPDEILEAIGKDSGDMRATALVLTRALYSVFNRYDIVSLDVLAQMGKRSARQALAKLDAVSPFVCDYVMLTSLKAHAMPLTPKMIEYLKAEELVHPKADGADIQGFLTRQISATKAYEFYVLLRQESEKGAVKAKTKSTDKIQKKRSPKKKLKSEKKAVSKKKK